MADTVLQIHKENLGIYGPICQEHIVDYHLEQVSALHGFRATWRSVKIGSIRKQIIENTWAKLHSYWRGRWAADGKSQHSDLLHTRAEFHSKHPLVQLLGTSLQESTSKIFATMGVESLCCWKSISELHNASEYQQFLTRACGKENGKSLLGSNKNVWISASGHCSAMHYLYTSNREGADGSNLCKLSL